MDGRRFGRGSPRRALGPPGSAVVSGPAFRDGMLSLRRALPQSTAGPAAWAPPSTGTSRTSPRRRFPTSFRLCGPRRPAPSPPRPRSEACRRQGGCRQIQPHHLRLSLFKKALEGNSRQLDSLKRLAKIYFDKGNDWRAAHHGREAVLARPKDANLRISLGDDNFKAGKKADPKKQYLKAKDLDSKRAASRPKKAQRLARSSRPARSVARPHPRPRLRRRGGR